MRYLYSIANLWCYRKRLKTYLVNKKITQVNNFTANDIKKNNIKTLVLDFDGVLNSHGELEIKPDIAVWLEDIIQQSPNTDFFILSNKPNKARLAYFNEHFPKVKFIAATRKKPYTDGLEQILTLANTNNKDEILIIDDRIATGILAAELFGCKALLVFRPFANINKRPITERFFALLRFIERIFVRITT